MAEQSQGTEQNYKKLRSEFDHLQLEEKAVFLIESGMSLVIHGLDSLVTFIRDEVNKVMEGDEKAPYDEATEDEAAEKEADSGTSKDTSSKTKPSKAKSSNTKSSEEDSKEDGDNSDDSGKSAR